MISVYSNGHTTGRLTTLLVEPGGARGSRDPRNVEERRTSLEGSGMLTTMSALERKKISYPDINKLIIIKVGKD